MRHRDSSREPVVSARKIVPTAPIFPASPSLRWLLALSLCGFAQLAPGSAVAGDSRLVFNVVQPHGERDLLQAVFQQSTQRGVSMPVAAAVIQRLKNYIDGRTESGKPATVCVGMSANLLVAADSAKWSVDDSNGVLTKPEDIDALAAGLKRLIESAETRIAMGRSGREKALRLSDTATQMNRLASLLAAVKGSLK